MMRIGLMKFVDEYAGRMSVKLIRLFRKHKLNSTSESSRRVNILFIKFWGIGSIVLSAPAVEEVRRRNPGSKIYYLTLKANEDICRDLKSIDETVCIRIDSLTAFLSDTIAVLLKLRKIHFNFIYDFEFYTYFSACIAGILNSARRTGFDNAVSKRKLMFDQRIAFNENLHTMNNFISLVNAGIPENFNAKVFVGLINVKADKIHETYIVINPNASRLAYERRLPREYFAKIINEVISQFDIRIKLIGSRDEMDYVSKLYEMIAREQNADNCCGFTSVSELISLIAGAKCLITNDSGPLHIASLLNVPSISFFGPESPARYGPLSEKNLVFYNALKCSPCMSISNLKTVNCIYKSPKCMEEFDVRLLLDKVNDFLRQELALDFRRKYPEHISY